MNIFGRVALCGAISTYNQTTPAKCKEDYFQIHILSDILYTLDYTIISITVYNTVLQHTMLGLKNDPCTSLY